MLTAQNVFGNENFSYQYDKFFIPIADAVNPVKLAISLID